MAKNYVVIALKEIKGAKKGERKGEYVTDHYFETERGAAERAKAINKGNPKKKAKYAKTASE